MRPLLIVRLVRTRRQALLDRRDLVRRQPGRQPQVLADQAVGDPHQLAEHLVGSLRDAHVVAERLAHLLDAVEALEERHGHGDLRGLIPRALELPPHEQVEELIGPPQLDVGLHRDRVVALQERVHELHDRDRTAVRVALAAKSSRSSIRATVYEDVNRSTASMSIRSSHSELYRTSSRSLDTISPNCSRSRSAYALTTSLSSRGRVSDFPDGSPTRAVKSPTISTAMCPASWNWRSLWSTTAQPSVTSEAVGIQPELHPQRSAERELLLESAVGNDLGGPVLQQGERGREPWRPDATSANWSHG